MLRKALFRSGKGAARLASAPLTAMASVLLLALVPTPALAQVTGALPPATAALKRDVTVSSDIVRIGDLIDRAGTNAHVPVFRAPDLGQTGKISAVRVVEAVRGHGLAAVETRGIAEITVTRASRLISAKDLEQRVINALAAQPGVGDPKSLTINFEREPPPIHVDPSLAGEPQITRVNYDPRSSRFEVILEVPASTAARRATLRFAGTALEMADAAVLMRPLDRGDIVKASDIAIERRPKTEVRNDVANAVTRLVGLAARRQMRAGEVLRRAELAKPEIVQRNQNITIVYEGPGLLLTTRGKAQESGAEGDTVNVLNIQSKRVIQATVSAPGQVTIAAAPPRVVAAASSRTTQSEASAQPGGEPPR